MNRLFAAALLVGTALSASASAANLVTNGTFSTTTYGQNNQFGTGFGGQGVTGWTGNNGYNLYFTSPGAASTQSAVSQYSGGKEDLWGPVPASPGGGAFVGLDGDQTPGVQGGISQTISGLTMGQSYSLTFDFAAAQVQSRSGATTDQLKASLGGQSFLTPVVSNPSEGFTGWFSEAFTFTATGTSEVLSFLSIGTPGGLPPMATLDDVSLTPAPEPLSLALLGAGVLGLGLVRRARRS